MGPETLIPLLVSAGGTIATISAQEQADAERKGLLNRQLERDDQASQKNNALVQEEGKRFDPNARLQGLADQEQKTYDQTQADMQGAGGGLVQTAATDANVSDDFLKTKAARAIEEGTRLTSIAREAAKARAPGQLGMDDSLSMANLAGQQQNLFGGLKNLDRATGLDAQSVTEPGYGNLGRVATALGGAMAGSGYGQQQDTIGVPANPYYKKPVAGINFGSR